MSRVGKQPIALPDGVSVRQENGMLFVKGPKGELTLRLHPHVTVTEADASLTISVARPDDKTDRALWGLFRMLVANMVTGASAGFSKKLEIQGVGYRVVAAGRKLTLNLGFSHQVEFPLPDGVEAKVEGLTIALTGIDKQLVGETAAQIRRLRKPEPYKGKGIRYEGEVVRRKAGKVVKGSE